MCGIAGIIHLDGTPPDKTVIEAMTDALAHRGPDGCGIRIIGEGQGRAQAGLGHRRLAIVDLSPRGAQPMSNEDGTLWLTFNGEIYNYRELRTLLAEKGHVFSSNTDSEVIIHGYEEWGTDCAAHFDGMFAFGLWDAPRERLFLARDRWGKKPLHYWADNQFIAFASELGALLKHPRIPREVDDASLSRFLLFEYIPAPSSIIRGAGKLEAAHTLVFEKGRIDIQRYWSPTFPEHRRMDISIDDAAKRLEDLLRQAVKKRLMSDVPLGVFLSGGCDSSAITSLMAEIVPPREIQTFSIGFNERSFDESSYARTVAETIGTTHHERILTPSAMLDILPEVLGALTEPMADASILPTYLLSRFTREHVTVALGGDGGDELLAGYDPFIALTPARMLGILPRGVLTALSRIAHSLPPSERNMGAIFRLQRFFMGMNYTGCARQQAWLSAFLREQQTPVLQKDRAANLMNFDPMDALMEDCQTRTFENGIDRASSFYLRYYMAGHILAKVDQASMSNSLEVRAPFLDTRLADFACSLPPHLKLLGLTNKRVLRHMLRGRVPDAIRRRAKKGFGIPLASWLRGPLRERIMDTLGESAVKRAGLFEPHAVSAILDDHMSRRHDRRKEIWTLFIMSEWHRRFLS